MSKLQENMKRLKVSYGGVAVPLISDSRSRHVIIILGSQSECRKDKGGAYARSVHQTTHTLLNSELHC